MKVSGFTIARNAIQFNYPVLESIQSILPLCDEFIVNVGDSEDDTLKLIASIRSDKIKIIQNKWDMSMGKEVLSHQTNLALKECKGDWAFYLQSDEVVHENDLFKIKSAMQSNLNKPAVDALRFRWLHFYGSYWRYRIDAGWYQKQDRIIRNNGTLESWGDAYSFRRKDGKNLTTVSTDSFIYHYGWVQPDDVMAHRRKNADDIGFITLTDSERVRKFDFGDLSRFPVYFGTHPAVMSGLVNTHQRSLKDWQEIKEKHWWHPFLWTRARIKTGQRVKERIV